MQYKEYEDVDRYGFTNDDKRILKMIRREKKLNPRYREFDDYRY